MPQAVASIEVPEAGQLVEVRRQQYVVTDVARSTMPLDPLRIDQGDVQHLVKLTSVEEDSIGDDLEVIWELEPGARLHDRALLPTPDGFDDPKRLDAFLDAIQWGAIESVDSSILQSPFRSGISIEDYQLDPLVRALQMPRVSLLIADDVGLGKTIEAGLVAQELLLRHRARTILVVVPASLQIKWRDEMLEKFGLEFRIVDKEAMGEIRRRRGIHVNPWTHFPRLIVSIDFLKRERPLRLFRECLPAPGEPIYPRKFDLLIVDEAHNVAPAGRGQYATDSLRTEAIRTLAPHFEHKLFLTATPHNGYQESFTALLELLDDQRFARGVMPEEKQLHVVMVHRLKKEIVKDDGSPRFPERHVEAIEISFGDDEREAYEKLKRYAELYREAASAGTRRVATEFVIKLLKKRMFSSPAAFLTTLAEHKKTLMGLRDTDRRSLGVSEGVLRRELERSDEEVEDDDEWEDAGREAMRTATKFFDELSDEGRRLLLELEDWAERSSARPDAKARRLIEWLNDVLRPNGDWNQERVIIFTEYRATQKWLYHLLSAEGLVARGRLMTLYGGMPTDDRERIKAAFQANPETSPVRILLATDTASEGIDLQNWCHRLIHYEIPWNPMRMEQRNGRIDRHGQTAEEGVMIHHFVGEGWRDQIKKRSGGLEGDLEFLAHVVKKMETILEDLGKVGPVIADQVEEAMLGNRRRLDTEQAERDAKPLRRMIRFERELRETIAKNREQIETSRKELRVYPDNLRRVAEIGLELAGQPPLEPIEFPGISPDGEGHRRGGRVFHMPELGGSWARCLKGLEHPHTREVRPIIFNHEIAAGRDDVVLVHMSHPLVQMSQRLLRAEIWKSHGRRSLYRVTARFTANETSTSMAVVAHARLLVTGGTNRRLHEEIITAGGTFEGKHFRRTNVGETCALLEGATEEEAPEATQRLITDQWPGIEESVLKALEARVKDRVSGLEGALRRQAEREVEDLTAIMEELARRISSELEAEPRAQLELFNDDERIAFERNRQALETRLSLIPAEIERETQQIRSRYEDPTPRLFPVALTFLVPRGA